MKIQRVGGGKLILFERLFTDNLIYRQVEDEYKRLSCVLSVKEFKALIRIIKVASTGANEVLFNTQNDSILTLAENLELIANVFEEELNDDLQA